MKKFLKILFYSLTAVYPIVVFTMLVVLKMPVRILSLCVVAVAGAFFLSSSGRIKTDSNSEKKVLDWRPLTSSVLFLLAGILCFVFNEKIFLKLYSVVISCTMLFVFASSLVFKPNIIFRFACLADKSIKGSAFEKQVYDYCKKVTVVWCVFFILNGTAAAFTALYDFGSSELNDKIWSVYNGGISYVLMGLLFTVEFIIRKIVDKKMIKPFSLTKFNSDSRKDDYILCFEEKWSSKIYKTWKDFLIDSAKIRKFISENPCDDWILHCEDYWYFLCTFAALLQMNKRILLTQNVSENFIKEIKTEQNAFLTDQNLENSISIQNIIENSLEPSKEFYRNVPKIDSDSTRILMYTSGSTGKPKAVSQRMTEFENDNSFIISKWAKEFTAR